MCDTSYSNDDCKVWLIHLQLSGKHGNAYVCFVTDYRAWRWFITKKVYDCTWQFNLFKKGSKYNRCLQCRGVMVSVYVNRVGLSLPLPVNGVWEFFIGNCHLYPSWTLTDELRFIPQNKENKAIMSSSKSNTISCEKKRSRRRRPSLLTAAYPWLLARTGGSNALRHKRGLL